MKLTFIFRHRYYEQEWICSAPIFSLDESILLLYFGVGGILFGASYTPTLSRPKRNNAILVRVVATTHAFC